MVEWLGIEPIEAWLLSQRDSHFGVGRRPAIANADG